MRSTSSPRAATSVATTMSSLPFFRRSIVRSRATCVISPLSAALARPRASSFSPSSVVAWRVRTKISIASKSSTSRMRVSASSLSKPRTSTKRWSTDSTVAVLALTLTSTGFGQVMLRRSCECDPATSRKTAPPAFPPASAEDVFDVLDEAHAQHLVGFVDDDGLELVELQGLAAQVVLNPARRADDGVHAAAQLLQLELHARAAVDGQHVEAFEMPRVRLHRLGDLNRELARRREHEQLRLRALQIEPAQQRQRERRGLAGARSAPGQARRGLRAAGVSPPVGSGWATRSRPRELRRARARSSLGRRTTEGGWVRSWGPRHP